MSRSERTPPSQPSAGPLPPIAIVGIGCRFPGARGPEALWRIVALGRSTVGEVPEHRVQLGYSIDRYHDPRPRMPGRISSCKAGFIEHPERFDPLPFGLTPRDAAAMEPQARMMLEVVWDAIEDAGLPFEALRGERVAVLVGHTAEDFSRERIAVLGEGAAMRGLDVRTAIGYARAAISGRISHLLDLRGPSLTLDTACSSSLYATHLACQSIWRGESKLAFAGGVNLFLTPEGSLALSRSGMMAPDGRCKAFDARADGFVRAEGAGVVLLRPLADAQANGDHVYALIRGTGVSADGRDGGHMMAPGRSGQVQAMRDAYRLAGFAPCEIDFVETHGTGTAIGDPVEIAALGDVMSEGRGANRPLRVSSIKGNIGHAESASGAAGLIKAALAIEHRVLPAQLHFETPSPQIAWDALPIEVQRETAPWPHGGVARAGVNAFGISGTNAHIVLESAPDPGEAMEPAPEGPLLLPITAHDPKALKELVALHLDRLRAEVCDASPTGPGRVQHGTSTQRDPIRLADLGYTLSRRRSHHGARLAVVADSPATLTRELEAQLAGTPSPACPSGHARAGGPGRLVFVFPGQGGQWLGMGRDLLDGAPAFRASIEAWDRAYRRHADWSLLEVLRDPQGEGGRLERLSVLQPVLVALQIALVDLLADHGVVPDAVLGQSLGEIAAAAVAGVLSRDEVARLACRRGAAIERVAGKGAMGLVALAENEIGEALASAGGRVEIAGQNGPATTLIAGDRAPLLALLRGLEARGVFARPLDVDFASHCFHMDPLLGDFAAQLGELAPRRELIPFYSSVEGGVAPGRALDTAYWLRNLRQRVRFTDAMRGALEHAETTFVEISPHPTLARPIGEIAAALGKSARPLPTLCRGQSGHEAVLRLLGALFVTGHPVSMERLHPHGRSVRLPLYPHQKRTLWFGTRRRADLCTPTHPLLGASSQDAEDPRRQRWETILDRDVAPALALAQRDPLCPLPASFCAELALAVAAELWPGRGACVEGLRLPLARAHREAKGRTDPRLALQVNFEASGAERGRLRLYVRPVDEPGASWRRVAAAELRAGPGANEAPSGCERESLDRIRERCATQLAPDWPRAALARAGAAFPRRLDGLRALWLGERELLAQIEIPTACQNDVGHYRLHPVLLETGIALIGCVLEPSEGGPFARGLRRLSSFAHCEQSVWCHATLDEDGRAADLAFHAESGECLARLEGLTTRPGAASRSTSAARFVHRLVWSPATDLAPAAAEETAAGPGPHARSERWIVAAANETQARRQASALGGRCIAVTGVDATCVRALAETARRGETGTAPGLLLLADDASPRPPGRISDAARLDRLLACLAADGAPLAEVAVVTHGVHALGAGRALAQPVSALLWGIAATLGERDAAPGAHYIAVDLPGEPCADDAARVAGLLCGRRDGGAYAWGDDGWLEPRLEPADIPQGGRTAEGTNPPFAAHLESVAQGERRPLLYAQDAVRPGAGEVAVRVHAAALSQLDVRSALALDGDRTVDTVENTVNQDVSDPGERPRNPGVGRECAGVISAVGEGVRELRVGDAVVGFARGAVASERVTPAAWLVRLPEGLAFDTAAALPLAYVVAERALLDLAQLAPGERALVLAGGGGVGLAATRVARRRGARVLAAASTGRRRAALRASGAERVCDAAAGAFAAVAREWTQGRGVDVVISSVDDPRIEEALDLLAPGGRFVDLRPAGARSLATTPTLRGNRTLLAFDFDAWLEEAPQSVNPALRRAIGGAGRDAEERLPITTFPVGELARALRFAAQDRPVGRITIDLTHPGPLCVKTRPAPQRLSGELRHWISGPSARDIEAQAHWLEERGGRALLVCPTRPLGEQEAPLLEGLAARGLRVDLAKGTRAQALLELGRESGRLGSVVHVVDDAVSSATRIAEETAFMHALYAATHAQPPRLFLLVHRAPDIFGPALGERPAGALEASRGLRAFADALCRQRRRRGGVAASVAVADPTGGAAGGERRRDQALGLLAFDARGADGVVIPADPEDWPGAAARARSLLRELAPPTGGGGRVAPIDLANLAPERRAARLFEVVEERIANVLLLSGEARARLDRDAPLVELGLDSLMATELALLIEKDLGIALPLAVWAQRPSLCGLLDALENAVEEEGANR